MKKLNKILPRIAVGILILGLVTTLILSSVYAKYVSKPETNPMNLRPAAMLVMINTPRDDKIKVNFAADGEPGTPIGHTEVSKYYDFEIVTELTEVAVQYELVITFNDKVTERIMQARDDKFKDGVWCDYVVLYGTRKDENGDPIYENVIEGEEKFVKNSANADTIEWTYASPDLIMPNATENSRVYYRLQMIFYNNTMMPSPTGNGSDYFFSSDCIGLEISSRQIDPKYVGTHVYD